MIHDQETIDRIRELLELSQIRDEDILDEMTDHYLSEIERKVVQKMNHQSAIRSTFQHIVTTDFGQMSSSKKTKRYMFLVLGIVALFTALLWQQDFDQVNTKKSPDIESAWPDGWPLKESAGRITSHFGDRKHPVNDRVRHHKGIDIKANMGTPVIATGNAIVQEVGYTKAYGHFIILQHNARYATRYCHLKSVVVIKDEHIPKGMTIGDVGSSGMSTSAHLHYEIIDGTIQIDPVECIRA